MEVPALAMDQAALVNFSSTYFEWKFSEAVGVDVESLKAEGAPRKAMVVDRLSELGPPPQFRLIDCELSVQRDKVVLVGFHHERLAAYTAVSHTWGQDVYDVFDCICASECVNDAPGRGNPAVPCPGAAVHGEKFGQTVKDILGMCELLRTQGGCKFLWHDGVCIAQYDCAELEQTIKHMGWIYASAADTVIFLDYVGEPRVLLPLSRSGNEPTRWNTRVWTAQEALLSKRRRYCIRRVPATTDNLSPLTWMGFLEKVARSYEDDSFIAVIEEDELWKEILSLLSELRDLFLSFSSIDHAGAFRYIRAIFVLFYHTERWASLLREQFFVFPSLQEVLQDCGLERESKHIGDRINSVLGLAGITDFVAPKDVNFETSTIEFFKRLGQGGLRYALFCVNTYSASEYPDDGSVHTWLPSLARSFHPRLDSSTARVYEMARFRTCSLDDQNPTDDICDNVRYEVLEDGMLELRGTLHCVPVEFTAVTAASDSGIVTVSEDSRSLAISFQSMPDISSMLGLNTVERRLGVANGVSMPGPTDDKSDGPNCMNIPGLINAEQYSSDCPNCTIITGSSDQLFEVANSMQQNNPILQEAGSSSSLNLPQSSVEQRHKSPADQSIITLPIKKDSPTPVIDRQGRALQAGDKFSAHLVFGQFYPPHLVGDFSGRICLIVATTAGFDLRAPVSRVGTYVMSRGFHRDLFDTSTRAVILTYPIVSRLVTQ